MPQANLPPSLFGQFASLNDRVRKLESGGLSAAGAGNTPIRYLNPREPVLWHAVGASSTITVEAMLAGIHIWNVNAAFNFYINIVGRTAVASTPPTAGRSAVPFYNYLPDYDSASNTGYAVTLQVVIKQGSSAKNLSGVYIDGALQTVHWIGGTPNGKASGYDYFWFEIIRNTSGNYFVTGSKSWAS